MCNWFQAVHYEYQAGALFYRNLLRDVVVELAICSGSHLSQGSTETWKLCTGTRMEKLWPLETQSVRVLYCVTRPVAGHPLSRTYIEREWGLSNIRQYGHNVNSGSNRLTGLPCWGKGLQLVISRSLLWRALSVRLEQFMTYVGLMTWTQARMYYGNKAFMTHCENFMTKRSGTARKHWDPTSNYCGFGNCVKSIPKCISFVADTLKMWHYSSFIIFSKSFLG